MNKIVFFIFIFLHFKKIKSNTLLVNIELTQANSSIKVSLKQTTEYSSHGIISLPYTYIKNNKIISSKLNLGSLTLTNEIISLIIPFSIYDTELTFKNNDTITVGNDNWELIYSNDKISIKTPLILLNNSYTNNNASIILELYCGTCNESNIINKDKKIPDYTFFMTDDSEKLNITYLVSCSNFPIINSNVSFNISCIPFSPSNIIHYTHIYSNYSKIGFLIINQTNKQINYKSNFNNCESLLNGDSIFYDSNDKDTNYFFTLNSPVEIKDDNFPNIYSNSTNITNDCYINSKKNYQIICKINDNHFSYSKNDKDNNIYYIYEKKFCGNAYTGIMVSVGNGNFITNSVLLLFLFLIF